VRDLDVGPGLAQQGRDLNGATGIGGDDLGRAGLDVWPTCALTKYSFHFRRRMFRYRRCTASDELAHLHHSISGTDFNTPRLLGNAWAARDGSRLIVFMRRLVPASIALPATKSENPVPVAQMPWRDCIRRIVLEKMPYSFSVERIHRVTTIGNSKLRRRRYWRAPFRGYIEQPLCTCNARSNLTDRNIDIGAIARHHPEAADRVTEGVPHDTAVDNNPLVGPSLTRRTPPGRRALP